MQPPAATDQSTANLIPKMPRRMRTEKRDAIAIGTIPEAVMPSIERATGRGRGRSQNFEPGHPPLVATLPIFLDCSLLRCVALSATTIQS
jgi:hypothetical protein